MNDFDPSHKAVFQANFDSVGMCVGLCQNIQDDALGKLSGFLILL
jgi:hypothetical protein